MSVPGPSADCPFCAIAAACPPSTPANLFPSIAPSQGQSSSPQLAHILLSTSQLIAFLDHAPISRGHVLVATRHHREKLSEVGISEGMALGKWLGVVSRAVMAGANDTGNHDACGVGSAGEENVGDWNVVQNNGQSQHRHKEGLALQTTCLDILLTSKPQAHAQLKSSRTSIFILYVFPEPFCFSPP